MEIYRYLLLLINRINWNSFGIMDKYLFEEWESLSDLDEILCIFDRWIEFKNSKIEIQMINTLIKSDRMSWLYYF